MMWFGLLFELNSVINVKYIHFCKLDFFTFCWTQLNFKYFCSLITCKNLQWNVSFGTVTSIQGTQNLVPKKHSHDFCTYYLYWRDTFIKGKWPIFLGPETRVQPPFRTHLSTQNMTDHKRVDIFNCSVSKIREAFTNWTTSMKYTCVNSTYNNAGIR